MGKGALSTDARKDGSSGERRLYVLANVKLMHARVEFLGPSSYALHTYTSAGTPQRVDRLNICCFLLQ
jgi:hypothetical protein